MQECEVEGCAKDRYCKGLCGTHYQRLRRTGATDASRVRFGTPEESFRARTMPVTESGCLIWTGTIDRQGYGLIRVKGRLAMAHRYAWERDRGPIPDGVQLDHLCWNTSCANVDHLRSVTQAQNNQNRRGSQPNTRSGIRGVNWEKRNNKWYALVKVDGKKHFRGYFTDKEEASLAAADLRAEYLPYSQN